MEQLINNIDQLPNELIQIIADEHKKIWAKENTRKAEERRKKVENEVIKQAEKNPHFALTIRVYNWNRTYKNLFEVYIFKFLRDNNYLHKDLKKDESIFIYISEFAISLLIDEDGKVFYPFNSRALFGSEIHSKIMRELCYCLWRHTKNFEAYRYWLKYKDGEDLILEWIKEKFPMFRDVDDLNFPKI